jgi:hypothetical protein
MMPAAATESAATASVKLRHRHMRSGIKSFRLPEHLWPLVLELSNGGRLPVPLRLGTELLRRPMAWKCLALVSLNLGHHSTSISRRLKLPGRLKLLSWRILAALHLRRFTAKSLLHSLSRKAAFGAIRIRCCGMSLGRFRSMLTEPLFHMIVAIGNSQSMFRIVGPDGSSPGIVFSTLVESVMMEEVIINDNPLVVPPRTPSPKSPAVPVRKAEAEVITYAESKAIRGVIEWRIQSVDRRSPDIIRIIGRNINYIRLSRLNHNDLDPVLFLSCDSLLRRRGQMPVSFRPFAHCLNSIHDIRLLGKESIPEIRGPSNVLIQFCEGVRHGYQSLDAGIPGLLPGSIDQCLPVQILVPLQPLAGFHDFGHKAGNGGDGQGFSYGYSVASPTRRNVESAQRLPEVALRSSVIGPFLFLYDEMMGVCPWLTGDYGCGN